MGVRPGGREQVTDGDDKILAVLTKAPAGRLGREQAVVLPSSATKRGQVERLVRAADPMLVTLALFVTRDELTAACRAVLEVPRRRRGGRPPRWGNRRQGEASARY